MYCSRLGILALALVCLSPAHASTEYTLIKADLAKKTLFTSPAWSPDGKSIAYVAEPTAEHTEYPIPWEKGFSIRLATYQKGHWHHKTLLKDADWPVWSPDGRKLAFARGGVCVIDLKSGRTNMLDKDKYTGNEDDWCFLYPLSWSPSGRFIAYEGQCYEWSESWMFDLMHHRVIDLPLGDSLVWSSDGRHSLSAFNSGEFADSWEGFGNELARVVRTDHERLKWRTVLKNYLADSIGWPGGRFAWVSLQKPEDYGGRLPSMPPQGPGIYHLDLETRWIRKVADIQGEVSYSPNFRRFVFTTSGNLYVGDMKTWRYRLLATDVYEAENYYARMKALGWSPDGRSLAYVTTQGDIRIVRF